MKRTKRIILLATVVLAIGILTVSVFAASGASARAGMLAGLTGMSADEAAAIRNESGKTYGQIAKDKGVYDQFRASSLESKLEIIKERVEEGRLTQEQADELTTKLENCDGTGSLSLGKEYAVGFGGGKNQGAGLGTMKGSRGGNAQRGLGNGTSSAQ